MLIEKVIHLDWCDTDLKATPNGVDIWGNNGHCYFTWEAAIREAEAQGLRIPTKEDWEQSFEIIGNSKLFDFLKLNYAGYRHWNNGQYYSQGSNGYYWSSTPTSNYSYGAYFSSGGVNIANTNTRAYGFSVRCLKN